MEGQVSTPVFVTLTAPTCSGKSYLLDYIRNTAKLPCFVSTTTRPPREGEKNGVDYYFISDKQSREIEEAGGFAELATYRGFRYGVTKQEFKDKLDRGLAFLIVEPTGLLHYGKPALEAGAHWFKYFMHVEDDIRVDRFKSRFESDIKASLKGKNNEKTMQTLRSYTDRLVHMLTLETMWIDMHDWSRILNGDRLPEHNLQTILEDIESTLSFIGKTFQVT
jgi:guanylate kinase